MIVTRLVDGKQTNKRSIFNSQILKTHFPCFIYRCTWLICRRSIICSFAATLPTLSWYTHTDTTPTLTTKPLLHTKHTSGCPCILRPHPAYFAHTLRTNTLQNTQKQPSFASSSVIVLLPQQKTDSPTKQHFFTRTRPHWWDSSALLVYSPPGPSLSMPTHKSKWRPHFLQNKKAQGIRKWRTTKQNRQSRRNHGTLLAWLVKELDLLSAKFPKHDMATRVHIPDCTGVSTGVTLVNSVSKLLVSVGLVICGINGGCTLLW